MAIGMSAAGWKHKYLVWSTFALAFVMAVAAIAWRPLQKMAPSDFSDAALAISSDRIVWFATFSAAIVAISVIARLRGHVPPLPKAVPTNLRLQFLPNNINPVSLELNNIWYWYALRSSFTVQEAPSRKSPEGKTTTLHQWSLFVVFDEPVIIKQLIIDGNGVILPTTEVKDKGSRHAIIVISGDLGAAIIDIRAII